VRALGGRAEKVVVLGSRGFFDRLLVLPGGRVIFAECKRPKGGRLSAHQIERVRIYIALGAVVAIVENSADIDRLLGMQTAAPARTGRPLFPSHPGEETPTQTPLKGSKACK